MNNLGKSIPSIAGRIFTGEEISRKTLNRMKQWVSSFPSLNGGNVRYFQIRDDSDKHDPGGFDKGTVITLETQIAFSNRSIVPSLCVLHYRGTDPYNKEFQTSQARRLAELEGREWLDKQARGIFLTVHHEVSIPEILEIGDNRVVANFQEIEFMRNFRELIGLNKSSIIQENLLSSAQKFPQNAHLPISIQDSLNILLFDDCQIRPLGELPGSTLVIGDPVCPSVDNLPNFKLLVNAAQQLYGKRRARILFDNKSPFSSLVKDAQLAKKESKIVLTAIPKGLDDHEQESLMSSHFSAHLPFLPWHDGTLEFGLSGTF